MYKIVASGYFGFNNIGDEAILKGLIQGIQSQFDEVEIVVLSGNVAFTEKHCGVRAVNRMSLKEVCREMKTMDLFVSGGGSLLQDATSSRSILYYLGLLTMAKKWFKKKTMIYSQGIGPVIKPSNQKRMKKVLNRVDWIDVRDSISKQTLQKMGVTKEIAVTSDTVFGIIPPELSKGRELLQSMEVIGGRKNIAISLRKWKDYDDNIVKETVDLLKKLQSTHEYNLFLLPFHFNEDMEIISRVMKGMDNTEGIHVVTESMYVDDYLSFIGTMDMVLSMRLHGLIFATLMGVVPIGISYDPKIDSFLKEIEEESAVSLETISSEVLYHSILNKMKDLENSKQKVAEKKEQLSNIASLHNKALKDLLMK